MAGAIAIGSSFVRQEKSLKNAGLMAATELGTLARTTAQTLRGENAVGRTTQGFSANLSVYQATTGVAESINRMQDIARTLGR